MEVSDFEPTLLIQFELFLELAHLAKGADEPGLHDGLVGNLRGDGAGRGDGDDGDDGHDGRERGVAANKVHCD